MDLSDVIRSRRMVRSFTAEPLDDAVLADLCDLARRAPSAGNSQGVDLLVLAGADEVGAYWDVTLPEPRRAGFRWPGLVRAPALVLVVTDPGAYVSRYAEDDKAPTGLGAGADAWPVPYWWVDAGAAVEHLLLGAVDAGLGACLFGLFDHERAVAEAFGVPSDRRIVGTIALGRPAPDEPGRSVRRPRRPLDEVVHRGRW
ncbi:MAG: nitroreductase family protein [Aquihabitans sp.]